MGKLYLLLQNAQFRSQIFEIFQKNVTSGGKGALTLRNQNPADVPASLPSHAVSGYYGGFISLI